LNSLPFRVGGALRAPRRQSLLRQHVGGALLPAATPRLSLLPCGAGSLYGAAAIARIKRVVGE
jgi:hypothetical protein